MRKVRISKRYLLLPIVLIVFSILLYLVYKDNKERIIGDFNIEQLILAETASQGITSFFNEYQMDLIFLSQFKDIVEFSSKNTYILKSFYENHKNFIEAVTRVDEHGIIQYTFPEYDSLIGKDISYQKHVNQVIRTHQPVISDVFRSAQGYQAIALHVPIFNGKTYAGSLAILISIDKLGKLYLGKIKIRGTGNVWLLSENGVEIYCPVNGHTGKLFLDNTRNEASSVRLSEQIKMEEYGTAKSSHQEIVTNGKSRFDEKYVVFYRVPLGNTHWTIIISYQEDDIYIALTQLRNRLILIFSLLIVIILYYFYSLSKVTNVLKEEAKRKKAERTLRESEDRLKKLSNLTFEGILIHKRGIALDANESLIRMLGYSREELIGENVIGLFILPAYHELVFKNLNLKKSGPYEVALKRKDGTIFPAELEARDILYNNEEFRVAAIRDITQRKKAERELIEAKERAEESDRLKSAFLANMSHEIRTPMNGILGFAELLKEPGLNGEEQQEYIRIIQKSGTRMLSIINDIVDISKIESGLMEVSGSETCINDLIEFIYNFFKPEVENKGLCLSYQLALPVSKANITTDREKLYAILSNLVKNAVKYTEAGSIGLGYTVKGDFLEFFVKDTGIGIPIERQKAIFERFIQADVSNKMANQGAGLGLSITKAYVELLGGEIRVESAVGQGSAFYFTLPFNPIQEERSIEENEVQADTALHQPENLKILIAEDDESSVTLITHLVKRFSTRIVVAKTGFESVEACRVNPDLDLVLMDMQMPELNGFEATRQIRLFNREVIIIAQTAFAMTGDREKAVEAGCNDYIVKPIKKQELISIICKYFMK